MDCDSDGAPDAEEGTGDSDSDGIPDAHESNTNDGDSDGIPDADDPDSDAKLDSDGDGIPDALEGTGDSPPVAPPPPSSPACVWSSACTVESFNLAETDSNLKSFYGGFATDAHAYYVPNGRWNSGGGDYGEVHGYAARVSLSNFSPSGVEYFNLAETDPNLKGFNGGFVTDAHAYYVPIIHRPGSSETYHGYAARVSLSDFRNSGVEYLNLAETDSNLVGFAGGFVTDTHAYYVPGRTTSGHVVRVSLSNFSSSGVEYFNLADTDWRWSGFSGGFVTDTHAYYVPYYNGNSNGYGAFSGYAARVSLSDFSPSGVEYLNLAETNSNLKGFVGGFATDTHAYYVPGYYNGAYGSYAARVSLSDFSSSGVEILNLADPNSNLKGFAGGFVTDTHAYYVPFRGPNGYVVRVSLFI